MSKRILIVEDNPSLCYLYAKSFEKNNFTVDIAHDGQEALQAFLATKPDIVLCDIKMPHLSGLDTIEMMNSYPDRRKDVIIIIMSAYDDSNLIQRAQQLGVSRDKYLVKSQISLSEMVRLVGAYC